MDIDTFEDRNSLLYISDDTSESSSQFDLPPIKDDSIIVIDDDDDSLLIDSSDSECIDVEEIGMPDEQWPMKKNNLYSGIINAPENRNVYCDKSILVNNKKPPPLPIISSASVSKPTNVPLLKTVTAKVIRNESISKPNRGLPIITSVGQKSDLRIVPLNRMSYVNSTPRVNSMANASHTLKSGQGSQLETASNFVARIQKLPGGKYKVVPAQGKVPSGLENIFKRNSHFIKHKTATSHQNPHTFSNSTLVQQEKQISSGKSLDFSSKNRGVKLIPYTATSNDTIKNQKNIVNNDSGLVKTCYVGKQISSGLILSPKSQSLIQKDGQSLSVTRYGNSTKNVNNTTQVSIKNNDILSFKKSITNADDSSRFFTARFVDKTTKDREFLKQSNQNEVHEEEELSDEESDQPGRFISCHYEYCHTLVFEPELINGLYCSIKCKKSQAKQMGVDESNTSVEKTTNAHQKSLVNHQSVVSEVETKVPKRKHLSSSPCLEKIARNNDWDDVESYDNISDKLHMNEDVSDRTKSPELEDDDDLIVDLKAFISDENILNYLEEKQFKAAPNYLFDKPFPTKKNRFEVGQKLEGIDPEHEALFCVMTVVQVCGFRIKLHFDDYPDIYDFWVNADCPDLFYPGWCKENSRILQPPKNFGQVFDWPSYLEATHTSAAPKINFSTNNLAYSVMPLFRIGDKLEALDVLTRTLPKQIVCVGTVADIIGNRIRVHYDGWTNDYDCWMDVSSTNIHPVGWAKNNGRNLARPSGYNDFRGKKPFDWIDYLNETSSKPVPEEAFVPRPLRDFAINTVIEVVDIAHPLLVRTAEILDVRGDELKILYDGFASKYAYWIEDDSPDIHPVGWSVKTNHPIEIPAGENELAGCKIKGCTGKGNTNNLNAYNHLIIKDCPYEFDSWENSITGLTKLLDRLKNVEILKNTADTSSTSRTVIQRSEGVLNGKNNVIATEHNNVGNQKGKITDDKSNKRDATNVVYAKLRDDICLSLATHPVGCTFMSKQNRIWTSHNVQLGIPMLNTTDARSWSRLEVATYVDQVVTNSYSIHTREENTNISQRFLDQEIDGDVFLMLKQDEIMELMKIPFGHAVKIYSAIAMLRQRVPVFDWVDATCTSRYNR